MATAKGEKKTEQKVAATEPEVEPGQANAGEEQAASTEQAATVVMVPKAEVDAVLRHHVYASLALGLAPVPLVDLVGLTAVQLDLVRALAKKYEVPFKANVAKSIIGSLMGGILPVGIAPLFASLVKFVPVVGLTTGAVSMSLLGGASTYALGKVFASHFASGGTLLTIKAEKVQATFKEQYEKGKKVVASMKKKEAVEEESAPAEATAQDAATGTQPA